MTCLDALGLPSDLTTAASGTTYSVEPAGVVEVGPDGGVTVTGTGAATITATNGDLSATASVSVATFISLADLVAGGDGLGTGGGDRGTREFTGIDIDTGALATEEEVIARFNGGGQVAESDGVNPSPVEGTPFIDSVLFMNQEIMPINSEGVEVQWDVEDVDASGWSHILSNFTFLLEAGDRTINVAGRTDWDENVGVHAAAGVTFDLDHLREVYGADAVHTFSTTAGQSAADCGASYATLYIIYSNATDIIEDPAAGGDDLFWKRRVVNLDGGEVQLEEYNAEIPPEASFLTLATGVAGDSWPCDMGAFANARILAAPSGGGGKEFRRGDSDANGSVNITDAVSVLNHLFGGATEPVCFEAADINNDGQTNITDPVALLNHLFGQGPPPAEPGLSTCGPDPGGTGPDGTTLGCAQYESC